jgi:hypothetical protein
LKNFFVTTFFSVGKKLLNFSNEVDIKAKVSKNFNPSISNSINFSEFYGIHLKFFISKTFSICFIKKCESYPLRLCAKTGIFY